MIKNIAFKLFGKLIEPHLGYFDTIDAQLRATQMKISLHEYVSVIFFATLLAFMASLIVGSFWIAFYTLYSMYSYTLAIIISFGVSALTFFLVYYYPGFRSRTIRTKLERALPFSVAYMATAASSGINPAEIFKTLSLKGGDVGREAKRIYTDIKMFGMSASAAVAKAASRTPSPQFAELLWGMLSVMTTGGDLGDYLTERTKGFMSQYRRRLNDYSKSIFLYTEIYITLIIVGTLFFIVLSSIMSPLTGGETLILQTFLVFLFTPLVGVAFIILLKGLSPTG